MPVASPARVVLQRHVAERAIRHQRSLREGRRGILRRPRARVSTSMRDPVFGQVCQTGILK